jgi:hypothetical protein
MLIDTFHDVHAAGVPHLYFNAANLGVPHCPAPAATATAHSIDQLTHRYWDLCV